MGCGFEPTFCRAPGAFFFAPCQTRNGVLSRNRSPSKRLSPDLSNYLKSMGWIFSGLAISELHPSPPSRLHKQLLGRAAPGKCAEGRERRSGPPGRSGFLPVHRSDVENPRCRSRSPVRCTPGSPSFWLVDESLGLFDNWVRRLDIALLLLCHCTRRGRNLRKIGGHAPSSSCASVDEGGQALEGEGGGHGPRAETGEAVSCAVSLDGVPLRPDGDGEARWASSGTVSGADGTRLKTLSFGPETGKTTALAAEVAHVRRRRSSPSPRPTTGRFSKGSGPTSRQSISFTPANVSAKLPTVATDWYDRVTLRDARRRQGRHYLRDKATTKTAVLEREVLPQAQAPPTRASRPGAARSGVVRQQGAGQPAHEAGALERRRRPEHSHLQGVVGPRRVAGDDRAARTTALNAA